MAAPVNKIQDALLDMAVDREYLSEVDRLRVRPADYGLAFCLNIFARGETYKAKTHGMFVGFHPLRDELAIGPGMKSSSPLEANEVNWGEILDGYLTEGLIKKGPPGKTPWSTETASRCGPEIRIRGSHIKMG